MVLTDQVSPSTNKPSTELEGNTDRSPTYAAPQIASSPDRGAQQDVVEKVAILRSRPIRQRVEIKSIQWGRQPDRRQYSREDTWAGLFPLDKTRSAQQPQPRSPRKPARIDQVEPGTERSGRGDRDEPTRILSTPLDQESAGPSSETLRTPKPNRGWPKRGKCLTDAENFPDLGAPGTMSSQRLSSGAHRGITTLINPASLAAESLLEHPLDEPSPQPDPEPEQEQAQTRPEHGPWEDPLVLTTAAPEQHIAALDPRVLIPPWVSRSRPSGSPDTDVPRPPTRSMNQLAEHASVLLELFIQSPHDTTDISDQDRGLLNSAAAGIATIQARLRECPGTAYYDTAGGSSCRVCHGQCADTVFMPCTHLVVCAVRVSCAVRSWKRELMRACRCVAARWGARWARR